MTFEVEPRADESSTRLVREVTHVITDVVEVMIGVRGIAGRSETTGSECGETVVIGKDGVVITVTSDVEELVDEVLADCACAAEDEDAHGRWLFVVDEQVFGRRMR